MTDWRHEPAADPDAVTNDLRSLDDGAGKDDVRIGPTVGRYLVVEGIGRGAMGRVFRAYDPKLQREVALKVVPHEVLDAEMRPRMLREARAMARLSHPNVVAVHDVEDSLVGIMLVMEFVDGATLHQWIKRGPHPWQQVVERFVDAGRGLAAAHAEGLLHRDFKPANVLVSRSGQVKVTDFGLAKLAAATGVRTSEEQPVSTGNALDDALTGANAVVGTPRYMAPEQYGPDVLSSAVDQYALCIALWEALCGEAPFRGHSAGLMLRAKERGAPAWPAHADTVPASVVDAICRGLEAEPEDRFPNVEALLAALTDDSDRQRRRKWILGGSLAVLGGAAALIIPQITTPAQRCMNDEIQLDGIWDDANKQRAHDTIEGTGLPYADAVWSHAETQLDGYVADWSEHKTLICEAATADTDPSARVTELQIDCLHRAQFQLRAATEMLANADDEVVERAHVLAGTLPDLTRCVDVKALQAETAPPSAEKSGLVDELRLRLARGRAERLTGHDERARQLVASVEADLEAIEYEPVSTEVALEKARVLERLGSHAEAETAARRALQSASSWGQWDSMQQAASLLMVVVGVRLQQPDHALRYREIAAGLAKGHADREARWHHDFASLLRSQGDHSGAEHHQRRYLALVFERFGPNHLDVASARVELGRTLGQLQRNDDAQEHFRLALQVRESTLGTDHPLTRAVAALVN
ncbi:MAG: serine/threonine-protein kinase [Myxococcota bacterium]